MQLLRDPLKTAKPGRNASLYRNGVNNLSTSFGWNYFSLALYFLTFLLRELSCLWKSTPIPSSTGEGGPLKKKFESFGWTGEEECTGEFPGLGNSAISEPESGVRGKPKHVSSTENDKIKKHSNKKNHFRISAIISLMKNIHVAKTPPSVKRQIITNLRARFCLEESNNFGNKISVLKLTLIHVFENWWDRQGGQYKSSHFFTSCNVFLTFRAAPIKGKGFWIR